MSEAASREISIKLQPTQQSFITSRAEADLFSCRMGEGKSTALCWAIFYHTQHNPGAKWALIRDTWENLRDTTLKEFFKWFPEEIMVSFKKSEKLITWLPASKLEGSVVCIGMDEQSDAIKLQSRELAGFAMDEPAPAAENGGIDEFVFTTAMTRLRQPGMKWYGAKLAQNSSDETHWTYRTFFDPGNPGDPEMARPEKQTSGYKVFQTARPENERNLPAGYYARMKAQYVKNGRQDLADRFASGQVGFQQPGRPVTPEFSRELHVANGLIEIDNAPLLLCWDFGGNPTCIFTQTTPMGHWNILECYSSDGGMGVYELIEEVVAGRISDRFHGAEITHYGDPAGAAREASSSTMTAAKTLVRMLGGKWVAGPQKFDPRIQPLRSVLSKTRNGTGLVQIDAHRATQVWHALRGGWHFRIHSNGVVADRPQKNPHSHPGDALSYGAAEIYPAGQLKPTKKHSGFHQERRPSYRNQFPARPDPFNAKPGLKLPEDGEEAIPIRQSYMRPNRAEGRR